MAESCASERKKHMPPTRLKPTKIIEELKMPYGLSLKFGFSALMPFLFAAALLAQSPPPKAQTCTACHGEFGMSPNGLWPNLAGQKAQYLEKSMRDYRDGRRQDVL